MARPTLGTDAAQDLLITAGYQPSDLVVLSGGATSSAFGFRSGGRRFVARFGTRPSDYHKDEIAGRWSRPGLPTAEVVHRGSSGDEQRLAFAISLALPGQNLHGLDAADVSASLPSLFDALVAMRSIQMPGTGFGIWSAPDGAAPHATWHAALLHLGQRADTRSTGWREALAGHPEEQAAFDAGLATLAAAEEMVPDDRDLIHGDLTSGNVLVDQRRVSGVIDWGNSMLGDSLYDIGLLLFWANWRAAIDRERVRALAAHHFAGPHFEERLRLYELHAGLEGLQYRALTGPVNALSAVGRRVRSLLD